MKDGRIKLALYYKQGRKMHTAYLKGEGATWEDIIRTAEWQANMCGVTAGVQAYEPQRRAEDPHKLFFLGATTLVSWS